MSIGWNFPGNDNGRITGISEAGIETFRGSLYSSLAKEICQNSLDARVNVDKPVTVEYVMSSIATEKIAHFEQLERAIELCRDYWHDNSRTVKFFNKAMQVCSQGRLNVLRISDFNTTGLTGSDKERSSAWQNLVKSSGVSDKTGISGGSYGIGKSAPFACSDLRTLYYATQDIDGIKAYQGVANLVSFRNVQKGTTAKNLTQGIGYYGNTEDNSPVFEPFCLDGFKRQQAGTDIYVLGFISSDSWRSEIIKAVLDGFLISILRRDLIVKVDNTVLNEKTLPKLIEIYKDEIPLAYNYYRVMASEETVCIQENFAGMGNISLYILMQKDFRRKVLMARSNGMKIFDQDRISAAIQFAGVCILEGEEINAFFREMETPQHNKWEPDRHSDRKKAMKIKRELYRFIKKNVEDTCRETVTAEMDAAGAGDFIPDISSMQPANVVESLDGRVDSIEVDKVDDARVIDQYKTVAENGTLFDFGITKSRRRRRKNKLASVTGVKSKTGGIGKNENLDFGYDLENEVIPNDGIDPENTFGLALSKCRIFLFKKEEYLYKLTFIPNRDAENAFVDISISGEEGLEIMRIKKAVDENWNSLIFHGNRIYIDDLHRQKPRVIYFTGDCICSLEVDVYGYKK